jgi:hypothetical protein
MKAYENKEIELYSSLLNAVELGLRRIRSTQIYDE